MLDEATVLGRFHVFDAGRPLLVGSLGRIHIGMGSGNKGAFAFDVGIGVQGADRRADGVADLIVDVILISRLFAIVMLGSVVGVFGACGLEIIIAHDVEVDRVAEDRLMGGKSRAGRTGEDGFRFGDVGVEDTVDAHVGHRGDEAVRLDGVEVGKVDLL